MKSLQLAFLFLMLIATILAFGFPQFRTYILQTISLLAVFSILLHHLESRSMEKERAHAQQLEEVALFLSTQVKPTLDEIEKLIEKNKETDAQILTTELKQKLQSLVHSL